MMAMNNEYRQISYRPILYRREVKYDTKGDSEEVVEHGQTQCYPLISKQHSRMNNRKIEAASGKKANR